LNAHLDAADKRIGRICDDALALSDTGEEFNHLTEITTHLNLSQFDHAVLVHNGHLQTFRAKQQSIGGQGQT